MKRPVLQPPRSPARGSGRGALLAVLTIVVAGLVAYHNSFSGPFVFDDLDSIVKNPTIRQLSTAFFPPSGSGTTVGGRPVVNLTLGLNYAFGGESVRGYHIVNFFIHLCAGLTLFGVVRHSLSRYERFREAALPLALLIAVLWTVHPLQTAAVTYVIQRAEALVSLFYLLTLYGVIRSLDAANPAKWRVLAIGACFLGMASKEVMVSAPLIALLYDRTFGAGTFREALRRRWPLYAGLAASWLLLAALVASTKGRGGSAGFATEISIWNYALTQIGAVVHYLRLALWPHPLVFDYGTAVVSNVGDVVVQAIVLLLLLGATAWSLLRRPALGFLGAVFFAVLAPTSSIVPIATQTMAEHRMYLPLAAVVTLLVVGMHVLCGRRSWGGLALLAVAGIALTISRNHDYRTTFGIWRDTAEKLPSNVRGHIGVGIALTKRGQAQEALPHLEHALQMAPSDSFAHINYGVALEAVGRPEKAMRHYEESLRHRPANPEALNNLGKVLADFGRPLDALPLLEEALRHSPHSADIHYNLANVLSQLGSRRIPLDTTAVQQALAHYEEALRLKPDYTSASVNLGVALRKLGRDGEAIRRYEAALRLQPENIEARHNLGVTLAAIGRLKEAVAQFEQVLRIDPSYPDAHYNLGNTYLLLERLPDAIAHLQETLRLRPAYPHAHYNLGHALSLAGRTGEAIAVYRRALEETPEDPEVHNNLGIALAETGQLREAIQHFERALHFRPDYPDARRNLAVANASLQGAGR